MTISLMQGNECLPECQDPRLIGRIDFSADLKSTGSFGGRKDANQTLAHNPVVFVHGVSHTVGTMMKEAAMHYW